jgi:hypothetical protein
LEKYAMKNIAICADSIWARGQFPLKITALAALFTALAGCAGMGTSVGVSVPLGKYGGGGVSVGSGGTVSGSVGVGVGGGSVSVGTSGRLPQAEGDKKEEKKP